MVQTFDVNRIGGGTFELVQDPATGRYSYQKVGLNKVKSLTMPDVETPSVAQTDTAAAAKTATEQTVKQQTTSAFKLRQPGDSGVQPDLTGQMVNQANLAKEAGKINPQINPQDVYGRPTMRQVAGESEFTRPGMRDIAGEASIPDRNRGQITESTRSQRPGITVNKTPIGSPFKAFDVTPKSEYK